MSRRQTGPSAQCAVCSGPTHAGHSHCPKCAVRHDADRALGSACECCGFDDPRMLKAQQLDDGKHTLCANCAMLTRGRPLTLALLMTERFPDARARAGVPPETERASNAVTNLLKEREHLQQRAGQERPCECSSCRSGGRPVHRAPRFSS